MEVEGLHKVVWGREEPLAFHTAYPDNPSKVAWALGACRGKASFPYLPSLAALQKVVVVNSSSPFLARNGLVDTCR